MFSRIITDSTRVSLSMPQYAEETFALTDRNRLFLRQWLICGCKQSICCLGSRVGSLNK